MNTELFYFKELTDTFRNVDKNIYDIILSYTPKCIICEAFETRYSDLKQSECINFITKTPPYCSGGTYCQMSGDGWIRIMLTHLTESRHICDELDNYLCNKVQLENIPCLNFQNIGHILVYPLSNGNPYKYIFINLSSISNNNLNEELQRHIEYLRKLPY